jgi:hypothetical protein
MTDIHLEKANKISVHPFHFQPRPVQPLISHIDSMDGLKQSNEQTNKASAQKQKQKTEVLSYANQMHMFCQKKKREKVAPR